jgi:membrane protein DedA with SNARE-associated domain
LDQLIREYGYLAILIVTFFEGESIVILAGIAASLGQLTCGGIIACALLGSIGGDQLWYYVGRRWGTRVIASRPSWQRRAEKVYATLKHHETWLMLTFRFYYGLRSVTPFAIGAARVPRLRFLVLNASGAVVWALCFTYAGYFLGKAGMQAAAEIKQYAVMGGVGLVVFAAATVWYFERRRRHRLRNHDANPSGRSGQRE